MTQFCERLKKYRREKGMTQQELADLLGVSNKTVSRWESDGGYPDVTMLVPLARALDVTVDDLLDEERPVRTLTRADWQNLLSFGFALGGGVLFFLFDLFMPMMLCYLAYLGCMAYGVYLQRYYAYQSNWFFLSNAVMDLSVNLSIAGILVSGLTAISVTINTINQNELGVQLMWWLLGHAPLVAVVVGLVAVLITALTQWLVLRWSRGKLNWKSGGGGHLRLGMPTSFRKAVPLFIPVLYAVFWLLYTAEEGRPVWLFRHQEIFFAGLTVVSLLLVFLCLRGQGWRMWQVSALMLTVVSAGSRFIAEKYMFWTLKGSIVPYREVAFPENYIPFLAPNGGIFVLLGILMVTWLLLCMVRVEKRTAEE